MPEKMADWEMQKKIPIQVSILIKNVVFIIKTFVGDIQPNA
jgi:hypothetical protein